jgi:hypothetical protein
MHLEKIGGQGRTNLTDESICFARDAAPLNPTTATCQIQAHVHTAAGTLQRSETYTY